MFFFCTVRPTRQSVDYLSTLDGCSLLKKMNATENHVNNAMAIDSHMRAVFTHSRNLDLPHVT